MIGDGVELIVTQSQELLRKGDGIERLGVEEIPLLLAVVADELVVELHVVPDERAAFRELIKVCHDRLHGGRAHEHLVLDARDADDLFGEFDGAGDEGGELFRDLPPFDLDGAHLDDAVHRPCDGVVVEARRFKVEDDVFPLFEPCGEARLAEEHPLHEVFAGLGEDGGIAGRSGTGGPLFEHIVLGRRTVVHRLGAEGERAVEKLHIPREAHGVARFQSAHLFERRLAREIGKAQLPAAVRDGEGKEGLLLLGHALFEEGDRAADGDARLPRRKVGDIDCELGGSAVDGRVIFDAEDAGRDDDLGRRQRLLGGRFHRLWNGAAVARPRPGEGAAKVCGNAVEDVPPHELRAFGFGNADHEPPARAVELHFDVLGRDERRRRGELVFQHFRDARPHALFARHRLDDAHVCHAPLGHELVRHGARRDDVFLVIGLVGDKMKDRRIPIDDDLFQHSAGERGDLADALQIFTALHAITSTALRGGQRTPAPPRVRERARSLCPFRR